MLKLYIRQSQGLHSCVTQASERCYARKLLFLLSKFTVLVTESNLLLFDYYLFASVQ